MRCFLLFSKSFLFLVSGLLLLSGCQENRALPTTADELMAEIKGTSDELLEVMKSVRDSDTAKAAEEKLAALRERLGDLYQQAREIDLGEEHWRELRETTSRLAGQIRGMSESPEVRRAVEQLNRLLLGSQSASEGEAGESPR